MVIERGLNGPLVWDKRRMGPRPVLKPPVPWVELAAVWGCAIASLYLVVG